MKKKDTLSPVAAYRLSCIVCSIGFYYLAKYLVKLNYEILNINLFKILAYFCFAVTLLGMVNFGKSLVTGKPVEW